MSSKYQNATYVVCPVTVGIPTYRRLDKLPETLHRISACNPQPDEIIIHVDGNDTVTGNWLNIHFPNIQVILSATQVGPGGGRNRIIKAAKNNIVASFDDDSYPLDTDYFHRLILLFEKFPNSAIINSAVFHQNEPIVLGQATAFWSADFIGCGCAYQREFFMATSGYVNLPLAYGMEETDLALRIHSQGGRVIHSPWLRIFHNTDLNHHKNPSITSASISNQLLLTYLRYPLSLWWLGLFQSLRRVAWLIRHGRYSGIMEGFLRTPQLIMQHHTERQVLPPKCVLSYLKLRRQPMQQDLTLDD